MDKLEQVEQWLLGAAATDWDRRPRRIAREDLDAIAEVAAELRERRVDGARLDWRESHPKHGFGLYADSEWADGRGGSHKTYREAIDAAMQGAER